METLFPQLEPPPAAPVIEGPFAGVALEQGIDHLLDYGIPPRLRAQLRVGQLVKVPLGRKNRAARGYVVSIHPTSSYPKIKNVSGIEDERVLVPPKLMELARWMSRYYVTPLGTVIDNIIPAAVKKKIGLGYSRIVRLTKSIEEVQEILEKTRAPKRRAVLARLLLLEPGAGIEINRLAGESGTKAPHVRTLVQLGLITITPEVDLPSLTDGIVHSAGDEPAITLNAEQQQAFDQL